MKPRLHPLVPVALFALCLGPVGLATAARLIGDAKEAEGGDSRKSRTDRRTSRSQDEPAEKADEGDKADEKKDDGKADRKQAKADRAAEQAQKRTQAAKEAMTKRKESMAAQAQAPVPAQSLDAGGEPATGGAKVIHASHTVYMKDGSKLTCSLLMTGERSVVVLTSEGELELKPADIERVVEVEAEVQTTPVHAATQLFEGNQYLTAPEVDQTEVQEVQEPDEADGSAGKEEKQTDQATVPAGEPERTVTIPEVPVLDASKLGLPSITPLDLKPEPAKVVSAPAQTPASPLPAPAKEETAGAAAPKAEPPLTAPSQPPKARPTGKPGETGAPVAGADAGKATPAPGDPKAAPADKKNEGGQGFTDLLKSLESQDGLNTVLEQLKNNPDFYKNIDIKK